MLIYVKILKSSRSLRNFVCGCLTVYSIQPVNNFTTNQELCNLEQNIDFENFVNKHCSAMSRVHQGKHTFLNTTEFCSHTKFVHSLKTDFK